MSIQLLCPTCSEKLNCPDQFAGKLGKCPHCGAKFKVPIPPKVEQPATLRESDVLADDDEMERVVDSDILDRSGDPLYPQQKQAPQPQPVGRSADEFVEPEVLPDDQPQAPVVEDPPPSFPMHPLANLFLHLWEQRMRGAVVELLLKDGERLAPERFAPGLSYQTHGVFTVKSMDGAHTIVAVSWDTVSRITLRGLRELPEGIFS